MGNGECEVGNGKAPSVRTCLPVHPSPTPVDPPAARGHLVERRVVELCQAAATEVAPAFAYPSLPMVRYNPCSN